MRGRSCNADPHKDARARRSSKRESCAIENAHSRIFVFQGFLDGGKKSFTAGTCLAIAQRLLLSSANP